MKTTIGLLVGLLLVALAAGHASGQVTGNTSASIDCYYHYVSATGWHYSVDEDGGASVDGPDHLAGVTYRASIDGYSVLKEDVSVSVLGVPSSSEASVYDNFSGGILSYNDQVEFVSVAEANHPTLGQLYYEKSTDGDTCTP